VPHPGDELRARRSPLLRPERQLGDEWRRLGDARLLLGDDDFTTMAASAADPVTLCRA